MDFKYLFTTTIALVALGLGIVNFVFGRYWADRTYAASFAQDATKWASEVVLLFNQAHFTDWARWRELTGDIRIMARKAADLYQSGLLIFPETMRMGAAELSDEEIASYNASGIRPTIRRDGNAIIGPHPVMIRTMLLSMLLRSDGIAARTEGALFAFVNARNDFVGTFGKVAGIERRARSATGL